MRRKTFVTVIIALFLVLGLTIFPKPVSADDPTATTPAPAFSASADATAKSGIPGSVVTYKFSVTNNSGSDPQAYSVTAVSVSGWTPAPSVESPSFSLAVGAQTTFSVDVPVPSTATSGQNDKETITISDGTLTQVIQLTTTVSAPAVPGRPLMSVSSYYINSGKVAAGSNFDLAVVLQNSGSGRAYNVVISFDGGTTFYPQGTGGVRTTSGIDTGNTFTATQTFLGAAEVAWSSVGLIKATVAYTDAAGTAYSDVFTISLGISSQSSSGYAATATPVASNHAQLIVIGYKIDTDLLQPGTTFNLTLDIQNKGTTDALSASLVLGGGASSSAEQSGTPAPGGVSGSSGELTNFAPLNSSNITYLGDVKKNTTMSVSQKLIVNTTTTPGVYTLKISFVYNNSKGQQVVDDQVITLLVYSLPQVEIDFYRDPGVITAQTMNVLPLQVTNLGKKSCVLGNMKVTADGADVTNNVSLVGALDPGGYYTLDTNITPNQEGQMTVTVTINYTDDFNQARTIEQKLQIDVQPAMVMNPTDEAAQGGKEGSITDQGQPETFWQKVGRFFKGLFGLNSGSDVTPTPSEPTQSVPITYPAGKG